MEVSSPLVLFFLFSKLCHVFQPSDVTGMRDDSCVGQKCPGVGTGCWDRADGRPLGSPCYAGVAHGLDEGGRSHPAKGACGRKAPFKGPMDQRGLGTPPLTEEWDKGLQQRRPRGRACATPTLQGGCDAPDADRTPPRHGKSPHGRLAATGALLKVMVRPGGFEPSTIGLEDRCSIH